MEALNLNLKHDIQSQQRLFDIIQTSGHGHGHQGHCGGGGGGTVEFMLRSFDHDELVSTSFSFNPYHQQQNQLLPPPIVPPVTILQQQDDTVCNEPVSVSSSSSSSYSTTTTTTTSTLSSSSTSDSTLSNNPQERMMITTLELDPNIILQNYVNDNTDFEDAICSNSNGGKGRPHVCTLCQASYKTRTHLRRHMMIHLHKRPYPCMSCGKGFNRKEHLSKHAEAVHSGTKHKCPFCGKEISRKDHLARHIKNMHPSYASYLNKDEFLSDPSELLKITLPSKSSTKSQPSPRQLAIRIPVMHCQTGNITTRDKAQQNSDTDQNILSYNQDENVQEQNQRSTDAKQSELSSQLSESDQNDQVPQTEIILGNETFKIQQLANIVISKPSAANVTLTSTMTGTTRNCGPKSIFSKPTLKRLLPAGGNGLLGLTNLSLTLGGQIKEAPFANCSDPKKLGQINMILQCSECSLTFTSEKDLTTHLRGHKPQNYHCTECPRAYTRREKLTEHIRCFHQGQKFQCEHCGKELSRKDHVLRHVRSMHPELLASRFNAGTSVDVTENLGHPLSLVMEEDDHGRLSSTPTSSKSSATSDMGALLRSICQYCLKVFGTSYHLSRHIESCHNGDVRPYPCMSCLKQFKRKDHLTKHMKSHCPTLREMPTTLHEPNRPSSPPQPRLAIPQPRFKQSDQNHTEQNNYLESTKISRKNNTIREPRNNKDRRKSKHENKESSSTQHRKTSEDDLSQTSSNTINITPFDNPSSPSHRISHHQLLTTIHGEASQEDEPDVIVDHDNSQDFNLAMINSFIGSADVNVDVVMGEGDGSDEDLSSIILAHSQTLNTNQEPSANIEAVVEDNLRLHSNNDDSIISSNSSSPNDHATAVTSQFRCGHCQKEDFSSRDQLLEHLQDHSNSDQDVSSPSSLSVLNDSSSPTNNNMEHGLRRIQFSNY